MIRPDERSRSAGAILIASSMLSWGSTPSIAQAPAQSCSAPTGKHIALNTILGSGLERLRKGRLVKLSRPPSADVYVLYFGASWCGPCGAFARAIKPIYESGEPGRLRYEIVFVSQDKPADAVDYIRRIGMPWPYLKAGLQRPADADARAGGRILPDLIVVDRSGRVLCQAVDASGRTMGVRQTFERMRTARRIR